MDEYLKIIQTLEEGKDDAMKFFNGGNGAAGTRTRQRLLQIKNQTHELRKVISETKNSPTK